MHADTPGSSRAPKGGGKRPAAGSPRKKAVERTKGNPKVTASTALPEFPMEFKFKGHKAVIRPLQPSDRDTLIKFFESHTQETIHLRYGYEITQISEARAAELVGVDQTKDAALGIFEQGEAVPLVAIGRYCLRANVKSAEVAFVVREDRRRMGMATELFYLLLRIAASRGLETVDAQVLRENQQMLEIFGSLGGVRAAIPGTGSLNVKVEVRKALRKLGK